MHSTNKYDEDSVVNLNINEDSNTRLCNIFTLNSRGEFYSVTRFYVRIFVLLELFRFGFVCLF